MSKMYIDLYIKERYNNERGESMGERTEALKKAQQKYMEKFAVARVRMEREKYEAVQAHAEARGESVNGFVNRAIEETMERDGGTQA